MPKNHTTIESVSLSPEKAAQLSGVSSRTIYRLLAAGAFTARRMGARTLIDAASWRNYFSTLPEYTSGTLMPNHPHNHQRRKLPRKSKLEVR
jgi:excisionase family DNA binding protein